MAVNEEKINKKYIQIPNGREIYTVDKIINDGGVESFVLRPYLNYNPLTKKWEDVIVPCDDFDELYTEFTD